MKTGFEFVASLPPGETAMNTVVYNGMLYVSTQRQVFVLKKDKLIPVHFIHDEKDPLAAGQRGTTMAGRGGIV